MIRNPKNKKTLLILVLLCFSIFQGYAQVKDKSQSEESAVLPFDALVRTGKLANGFTYFIRKNTEPKNRVLFYLANKVGSILETEDQRGLAHFMEHMNFNGTKHFPKNELVDYLQKAGVRFGADLNAYTNFDETIYQLPIPSDDPKLLKSGLEIMRDWAQEATLDPVEIEKERGVVLEEERLKKGAGDRMSEKTFPILVNNSRYAERLPIGLDTVLKHFKSETIKRFHHDWYRPDLQALIVVGDIDVDQMEKDIKSKFGDLKNPADEKKREKYTIPLTGQNHFLIVTDPEMTSTVAQVYFKHQADALKTGADYRKVIIVALFNAIMSERFSDINRQNNQPFIQSSAGIQGVLSNIDAYLTTVAAKPGELENGYKAVWRETERAFKYGFTEAELTRAKTNYLSNMELILKEKAKQNSVNYVNEYVQYFLNGTASPGINFEYRLVKHDLPEITLADVNHLFNEYIGQGNRDIIIMAPEKEKQNLPTEQVFDSWTNAVAHEELKPHSEQVSDLPLLSKIPAPGRTVEQKKIENVNVTELTLSNGVKVILKPTNFKDDEIIFNGFSSGGTSLYNDTDFESAANAAAIVTSGGVGNFNLTQLQRQLTGKQVEVSPFINDRAQGVNGASSIKDLETALQLTYLYFTQPRKDSSAVNSILSRVKASLINRSNDPNTVFSDTVSAVMGNYNFRSTGFDQSKLDQIKLDKCYRIYKERFADASAFTFTFVGNIDVEEIKPLLEKYLGSLPSTNKNEQAKDLGIHPPKGKISKTVYKGRENKATVELFFTGNYKFNELNNKLLGALTEVLQIRLLERLREDESGVYSPQANVSFVKYPSQRFRITVAFGCAPKNVEKLIASALDEIKKLKEYGPLEVNIDKYKAENQRNMETALKTNGFWLNYLTRQVENNEDFGQANKNDDLLNQLNKENIKQAANDYLSGENFIRLVLLPENAN